MVPEPSPPTDLALFARDIVDANLQLEYVRELELMSRLNPAILVDRLDHLRFKTHSNLVSLVLFESDSARDMVSDRNRLCSFL